MGDWATLVLQRLKYIEDVVSFGAVCKSWNSASKKIPMWLVLPEDQIKQEDQQYSTRRKFYSLATLQINEIELPQAIEKKCLGTFYGWLLTVDVKHDYNAYLLRPSPVAQFRLPPLFSFKRRPQHAINLESCVVKVAMSGDPQDVDKCVVGAIARDHPVLAYARIGDEVWTMYPNPPDGVGYYDVAYYKGAFYAVDKDGALFSCDVSVDKIGPILITAPIIPPRNWKQMYLIESSGDLLLVYRIHIRRKNGHIRQMSLRRSTAGFVVYKLEEVRGIEEYPYKWTETKNLRGRTLFLGGDVSVSSYSSKRAKPDCIYFSESGPENPPGCWDTRVYNMKNNRVEVLYYSPS